MNSILRTCRLGFQISFPRGILLFLCEHNVPRKRSEVEHRAANRMSTCISQKDPTLWPQSRSPCQPWLCHPLTGAMGVQMAFLLVKPSPHVALTETNQLSPSAEVQFYTVGDINSVAESPRAATATTGSQQMTGGSGLYDPVNYFPIVTARLHTLICMWPPRALFLAEPRR